ncbi:hypothetical protein HY838_00850 [Candidatus Azambacteria bacterium]|nr:hypothetical protein [Candidatus Azambacteria bacterium]
MTPPFFGLFSTGKVATHHFSFCRYDSMKKVSRQARGLIPHTSQEWQSSLIGIDSATKIRAFQNQVAASSPSTALDFIENHAATRDKTLKPHKVFHNRHLKCFLSIEIFFRKFKIIDPFSFYYFIVIFGNFSARLSESEGGAGIPPPTPPSRAARADSPSEARRYLSSKWVRAIFRISHNSKLFNFFAGDNSECSPRREARLARN